jgi:hypothetical protein
VKTQTATKQTFVKITAVLAFGIAAALLSGCASKQPPPPPSFNVAAYKTVGVVVQIPGYLPDNLQKGEMESAIDAVMQDILLQKGYTLLERTNLGQILQEQKLQGSGYTQSQAASFGDAAASKSVFFVTLTTLQKSYNSGSGRGSGLTYTANLSIKLTDVSKGITLWSKATRSGGLFGVSFGDESAVDAVQKAVRAVAREIPNQ